MPPLAPPLRTPMSEALLITLARGLGVTTGSRVLDVCCRDGGAGLRLAAELGARVTGIDADAALLERAAGWAAEHELADQAEFLRMDPGHLDLPSEHYDLITALGGVLTAFGAGSTLERLRMHLRPGGWLIATDPVYLDSPPPAAVAERLLDLQDDEGAPILARENRPSPIVRAIFEHGPLGLGSEAQFRALLAALGYASPLTSLLGESAWADYFAATDLDDADLATRRHEAAAFYGYGGRGTVGYLLLAASRPTTEAEHALGGAAGEEAWR